MCLSALSASLSLESSLMYAGLPSLGLIRTEGLIPGTDSSINLWRAAAALNWKAWPHTCFLSAFPMKRFFCSRMCFIICPSGTRKVWPRASLVFLFSFLFAFWSALRFSSPCLGLNGMDISRTRPALPSGIMTILWLITILSAMLFASWSEPPLLPSLFLVVYSFCFFRSPLRLFRFFLVWSQAFLFCWVRCALLVGVLSGPMMITPGSGSVGLLGFFAAGALGGGGGGGLFCAPWALFCPVGCFVFFS